MSELRVLQRATVLHQEPCGDGDVLDFCLPFPVQGLQVPVFCVLPVPQKASWAQGMMPQRYCRPMIGAVRGTYARYQCNKTIY
jgi:hypothetical protein